MTTQTSQKSDESWLSAVSSSSRLRELLTPKVSPYWKLAPSPKQIAFLLLRNLEAFYGGAAGGGKSIALLMAALQYMDVPGYAAIIFRKTYTDLSLPGALMDKAQEWLTNSGAVWRDSRKTWEFPTDAEPATLTFGFLETNKDKYRYQSSAFQFIGFDELSQHEENNYRYLFSRLRKLKSSPVPLRMRSASNPGGVGHAWVKARFITEQKEGRVFIPAKLSDNPFIDAESYLKSMDNLDPVTKQQLINGDWSVKEQGGYFRREWVELLPEYPKGLKKLCRFWDRAATVPKPGKDPDWTVGTLMGTKGDGIFTVLNVARFRADPKGNEDRIRAVTQQDLVLAKSIKAIYYVSRMEQEPGSSGLDTIDNYSRRVLQGIDFRGVKTTGPKEERFNPVSACAANGNLKVVVGSWNSDYFDELESLWNPKLHDDQADTTSGAYKELSHGQGLLDVYREEAEALAKEQEDARTR